MDSRHAKKAKLSHQSEVAFRLRELRLSDDLKIPVVVLLHGQHHSIFVGFWTSESMDEFHFLLPNGWTIYHPGRHDGSLQLRRCEKSHSSLLTARFLQLFSYFLFTPFSLLYFRTKVERGTQVLARPRENSSYRSRFRHGVQSLDDRFRFPFILSLCSSIHLYSTTIVAPVSLYKSPRRCMEIADAILTHAPIVQGPSYQTDQDQSLGSI